MTQQEPKPFDYEAVTWGGGDTISASRLDFLDQGLHLRHALKALAGCKGKILEVGCGSGRFIASVARARPDLEAHGCDLSETAVAVAAKRSEIRAAVASADALPYAEQSFAAVLMVDVLEHLPDPLAALREARRVMQPGGVFHLVFPCEGHPLTLHGRVDAIAGWKRAYAGHIQRWDLPTLRNMLADAGLRIDWERYSYHPLGQVYDTFVFGAMARGVDMHKNRQAFVESDKPSLVKWVRKAVSAALFAESTLLSRVPIGMTVHLAAHG